jgi:quaternary ammonium compound-resistance protein SugE
MDWLYLVIEGIFEVVWAIGLKYSQGFTKLFPSLVTFGGMIISFYLLSISIKTLPKSLKYQLKYPFFQRKEPNKEWKR